MVCIYCGSPTQVTNSRYQKRVNNIWRRRRCVNCMAIITTHEKPDLSAGLMIYANNTGALQPFIRDKLFLSVHASCRHRPAALQEAAALTETIIANLRFENANISKKEIAAAALTVLNRFDPIAATVYSAYHSAAK